MNFKDYGEYILLKHKLAVAIAVIQTKPNDTTMEAYINNINNVIINKDIDLSNDYIVKEEDFNISVDTFNDSNESLNILDGYDFNVANEGRLKNDADCILEVMAELDCIDNQDNLTQSTFFEESHHLNDSTFCESCTDNNIYKFRKTTQITNTLNYKIDDLTKLCENNDIETNGQTNVTDNIDNENNSHNNNIDSQQTLIYTLDGFINNTHVSQSQDDIIITNKNLIIRSKTKDDMNNRHEVNSFGITADTKCIYPDYQDINNSHVNDSLQDNNMLLPNNTKKHKNTENDYSNRIKRTKKDSDGVNENSEFELFNPVSNRDNYVDVLSQNNDTFYMTTDISGTNRLKSHTQELPQCNNCYNLTQNMNCEVDSINFDTNISMKEIQFSPEKSQILFLSNDICPSLHHNNVEDGLNNDFIDNTENTFNNYDKRETNVEYDKNNINGDNKRNDNFNMINNEMESESILNQIGKEIKATGNKNEDIVNRSIIGDTQVLNDVSDDAAESRDEIVSFKTLEELNKVKCYLNRRERLSDGNFSDSGFKGSQARASFKSASQYSDVSINEPAHCLLNFLTASQLSDKTEDIAEDISKVLGKLVDRLHDEEIYPNFLEELLDSTNALLNDLYEGSNAEPNALFKKDETIHRLLLLNQSRHVLGYTTDKITIILENTLKDIIEDSFETKNIDKAENMAYIFHVLEIILKRVQRVSSSEISVQNSQDNDQALKKSSLTEVWRKKWSSSKSDVIEGSAKKMCVLTKCGEVLNKIIVQAMDGYSLVAFAALECYNLLQN